MNQPPEYCPYCGTALESVREPMVHRCSCCEDYVFYNPTPGGSVAVVDGDSLLLVEDFRYDDRWKLPSGRVEVGETMREGAVRELEEETGLSTAPAALTEFSQEASEPAEGQHMTNVSFAVERSATTGRVRAGSDATDARFWTPEEFVDAPAEFTDVHVRRFGSDSLDWLLAEAREALA
ncbi:NUDIX hydrolase [Halobacteriales archaeon QS_1_67_19]|nr:MAG: NUDIX hydrolase [Halobacteriales archaeon QS_1_67_19]